MSLPSQQKSLITKSKGVAEVTNVPIPKLRDDYVLVRVKAIALNPTDWKHIDYFPTEGARVGCDFAGIVEDVGSGKLTKTYKKGDRIAGVAQGNNSGHIEDGAFGEYIAAKTGPSLHVPENISFEEAATLGVGVTTVAQGLYQSLGLPLPGETGKTGTVLVYGGSTATGSLAIQYAKLSGWKVVTTSSPKNFAFVKSLGADEAFDYNDPKVGEKIRAYTNDSLTHVFDTISEGDSPKISAEAISSSGGDYSSLLGVKDFPRSDVRNRLTLAYTALGEKVNRFGIELPAKPEDYAFASKFWTLTEGLLRDGKLKVHPPQVGEGFDGALKGLQQLREGKVSGVKLVYKV